MAKIDLITGFLGSGKTTFIKKYASRLLEEGLKIGILVNDYGAVNIDMMLLQELEGEGCELEMVAGACDAACHKRRFKSKLISMGMFGYDRVIVEPSGIFDVDEFFDVLQEDPIDRFYEIGSVIAVVDSGLESTLSEQAEYLLLSQISCSGVTVLSKTQLTDDESIHSSIEHVNRILTGNRCKEINDSSILKKDWNSFTDEDWTRIKEAGYRHSAHKKMHLEEEGSFQSLYFMNVSPSLNRATEIIKKLFHDSESGKLTGKIFRIKGFLKEEENWYELNATKETQAINHTSRGQDVFVVIGENLDQEEIEKYWR